MHRGPGGQCREHSFAPGIGAQTRHRSGSLRRGRRRSRRRAGRNGFHRRHPRMMFTIRGIPTAGIAVRDGVRAATPRIRRCYGRGRRPRGRGRAVPCGAGACEGGAVRTGGRGGCFCRPSGDGRRPDARRAGRGAPCGKAPVRRAGARRSLRRGVRHVRGARRRLPARTYRRCAGRMCAYRPHPVGRNRPRSLCRAGSGDDRGGRRTGAFGYGTDGFRQGRRIGDGARKRDEPCRDHRPEQGHRGAGRRCPGACGRSEPATG